MQKRIALAFSGGLDTSCCVPRLAELGHHVETVFVNTGGASPADRAGILAQATALGSAGHHEIDARAEVFDRFIRWLIQGNVLRGSVYPLSVAAERTAQAMALVDVARQIDADAVAHGSTGAGNDQVRFDVAFRVLAPDLEIITPIRDEAMTREESIAYLTERKLPVPPRSGEYSVNRGLWGTTLGGGWTHDSWAAPPQELLDPAEDVAPPSPIDLVITWEAGLPVALDGNPMSGVELVEALAERCLPFNFGPGIHVGETVLGIKGRIGFEAATAQILIAAHRELEKLVLTRWQSFWKDQLGTFYGDRLHEGHYFDPALRDIEALIASSQRRVTGRTRVHLDQGRFMVTGTESPWSMFDPEVATYGEENRLWTGDEARSFARVDAIPDLLAMRAEQRAKRIR